MHRLKGHTLWSLYVVPLIDRTDCPLLGLHLCRVSVVILKCDESSFIKLGVNCHSQLCTYSGLAVTLKGIVHSEKKILSLFAYLHFISNSNDFLSNRE